MKPLIAATEFAICVSIGDLVVWPEEFSDFPEKNPRFSEILETLGVEIDLVSLYQSYVGNIARAGRGDVWVYELQTDPHTLVAIDLYNEMTDQMDLIQIYVRCRQSIAEHVATLVAAFFNNSSTQVFASQQSISRELRDAVDTGKFPRRIEPGGYLQEQVRHSAR
jgi:hypothetical protein